MAGSTTAAVALVVLLAHTASAHMRWLYPAPRSDDAGAKSYPCGGYAASGTRPTLMAGPNIVTFEEVVNHYGAPFRIALSVSGNADDFDSNILYDHIPHNDAGGGTYDTPKKYAYNITLPDINCLHCVLQIINIMTDKIGSICNYPNASPPSPNAEICPSVYHSCADITIVGSAAAVNSGSYGAHGIAASTYRTGEATNQWRQRPDSVWVLPANFNGTAVPAGGSGATGPSPGANDSGGSDASTGTNAAPSHAPSLAVAATAVVAAVALVASRS